MERNWYICCRLTSIKPIYQLSRWILGKFYIVFFEIANLQKSDEWKIWKCGTLADRAYNCWDHWLHWHVCTTNFILLIHPLVLDLQMRYVTGIQMPGYLWSSPSDGCQGDMAHWIHLSLAGITWYLWLLCSQGPRHRNGKVVKLTALIFTGDVEACLQRLQWKSRLSSWQLFRFSVSITEISESSARMRAWISTIKPLAWDPSNPQT